MEVLNIFLASREHRSCWNDAGVPEIVMRPNLAQAQQRPGSVLPTKSPNHAYPRVVLWTLLASSSLILVSVLVSERHVVRAQAQYELMTRAMLVDTAMASCSSTS